MQESSAHSLLPNVPSSSDINSSHCSGHCWLRLALAVLALLLVSCSASFADAVRGTLIHEEDLRVAPSDDSAKLTQIARGQEIVVIEPGPQWTHVQAIIMQTNAYQDEDEADESEPQTFTGWLLTKALVTTSTPNADKIIFGEASDSEDQASSRRGRRDAAKDALRLYYRVYDLFPNSPLAAEGLYRAADIRWQVQREDVMTRPSARERQSYLRGQMDESWMKQLIKKYPGTKWADLAAFRLIENQLCGDWQGLAKCPDKEAEIYEKYASQHPQSPAAPEALYDAAWRRSALIEIYKNEPNQKKANESKDQALQLAQRILNQYGQSDWSDRAQTLMFYIQQGVPTYGNAE